VIICLTFACYRLWQQTELYDETIESIHVHLDTLHKMRATVLAKEIYTNDPVIRAFVDVLNDLEPFLINYSLTYSFDEEIPQEFVNGENKNESA